MDLFFCLSLSLARSLSWKAAGLCLSRHIRKAPVLRGDARSPSLSYALFLLFFLRFFQRDGLRRQMAAIFPFPPFHFFPHPFSSFCGESGCITQAIDEQLAILNPPPLPPWFSPPFTRRPITTKRAMSAVRFSSPPPFPPPPPLFFSCRGDMRYRTHIFLPSSLLSLPRSLDGRKVLKLEGLFFLFFPPPPRRTSGGTTHAHLLPSPFFRHFGAIIRMKRRPSGEFFLLIPPPFPPEN